MVEIAWGVVQFAGSIIAFTGGFGSDHHRGLVFKELTLGVDAFLQRHTTVDRATLEPEVRELVDQEVERVLVFGENEQPFVPTGDVLREHLPQFLELCFRDVPLCVACQSDQAFEFLDLGFKLGHVLGHREPLHEVVFELPAFRFGEIVEVVGQFAVFLLELAELLQVFEPFPPPFE